MSASDMFLRGLLAVALILFLVGTWHRIASGEPAENFPAQHHPWLHQLYSPSNEHCCTAADCHVVSYRIEPNRPEGASGYRAFFEGLWLDVPSVRVVRRADNPVGEAILCIRRSDAYVFCFIPSGEG